MWSLFFGHHAKCSHESCGGRPDPRCVGHQCTRHCNAYCGFGTCLSAGAVFETFRQVIAVHQSDMPVEERDERTRSLLAAYLLK